MGDVTKENQCPCADCLSAGACTYIGGCDKYNKYKEHFKEKGEIKINLNDFIKVKLTETGKEIFNHRFDELNKKYRHGMEIYKNIPLKEDENRYTEFQLWDFMQIYGHYMYMADPSVIDPIEIIYPARQKRDIKLLLNFQKGYWYWILGVFLLLASFCIIAWMYSLPI